MAPEILVDRRDGVLDSEPETGESNAWYVPLACTTEDYIY